MTSEHTVTSFDDELTRLTGTIARMGGFAERQLEQAIHALIKGDQEIANKVILDDTKVDRMEEDISALAIKTLALRQPVAGDLREVVSAIRISSDIERIADYAKNIAKRSIVIAGFPALEPVAGIGRLGRPVQQMVHDVLDAYVERESPSAVKVWEDDDLIDDHYNGVFREILITMMEDPRNIPPCTHLMFVAKNLERIGDHATNIAETIYYVVTGGHLEADYERLGPADGSQGIASRARLLRNTDGLD